MSRYVCIHAHFYQPPRENPWLEEVELQDSAYPYHDWNSRITAECYAPNTASRILDADSHIVDIVNNYSKISFNFGPTLLSWMERHEPAVYSAIVEANRLGRERFDSHSPAIAQVYNHMIMPLANSRDKKTQVLWGVRDYAHRFGGQPEGIWLSETAVDTETLEICVDHGIKFTILAPRQARQVRRIGDRKWTDVSGDRIDPTRSYLLRLPSGREISLFFYDGPVSQEIAFAKLLDDGKRFADRLIGTAPADSKNPRLINIATDGETYGHHHRFGDMALAYCLYHIEQENFANLTIYSQFLEQHAPRYEVEIFENSSWSCIHGVERWRNPCGCNTGGRDDWNQSWRAPLRGAMDWLRDSLALVYEEHAARLFHDPWAARDDYIDVILNRSEACLENFLRKHAIRPLSQDERVIPLKLLEMQRHAMLMFTSCGWFFDEISGIETVQVIQYAARAMQLAREVTGIELEPAYLKILERAKPNVHNFENAAKMYEAYVRPAVIDLLRVGAHYAVSSLFRPEHEDESEIYSYRVRSELFERFELGRQCLAIGRATLQSTVTFERSPVCFFVLHLGEQHLLGSIAKEVKGDSFETVQEKIRDAFQRGNLAEVISLSDKHFGAHAYSLVHLFKDEQRKVVRQIIQDMLAEVETVFRQTYQRHLPIMQAVTDMRIPIPPVLSTTVSFVLNTDIRAALAEESLDLERLKRLTDEAKRWGIELDRTTLEFDASTQCNRFAAKLERSPYDVTLLEQFERFLQIVSSLSLRLDAWQAQNEYFTLTKSIYPQMLESANSGHGPAQHWIDLFQKIGSHLQIRIN